MTDLDTKFIKPFVDGALNTLKIQCKVETTADKPFVKGTKEQPDFEIAGVLGIRSTHFNGAITLCFPKATYLLVMNNMVGEVYTEITPELRDGAAELLNIIFGSAKAVLNNQGFKLQMAIPTVIAGKGLKTSMRSRGPVIVLPFATSAGEFHIEICAEDDAG